MRQKIKSLIFCLIGLLIAIPTAQSALVDIHNVLTTSSVCPLSPPSNVTVTNITTTTADVSWSAVAGAVMYRVQPYDATSAIFLPEEITSSTSITLDGMEPGHVIEVCVSAYSCWEGEGGDENCAEFTTETIIITDIIFDRLNCTPSSHGSSNSVAVINLPKAPEEGGSVSAAKVLVCRDNIAECAADLVEFEMYADCFGQIQFFQTSSLDQDIKRTPPLATTCSQVNFEYKETNDLYFMVGEVTEINTQLGISYDVKISLDNSIRNGHIWHCMQNLEVDGCGENLSESGGKKIWLAPEKYRVAAEALHSNPSPFSNGFQATYYLAKAGPATLSLLDLNGRVLHAIQQGPDTPAGQHFAAFTDLDNLPSGIYLLQLQTDYQQQTVLVVKQP